MKTLYNILEEYGNSSVYPAHMPGHKRQKAGVLSENFTRTDITEVEGFDNLHHPIGILKQLQDKATALYGAEESFYLVNGSTGGILSGVSAAVPFGGHLLMTRGCHRSVYHGAYLRQLRLSYLYPESVSGFSISEGITAREVQQALEKQKDVSAVLIVSPTYEGRIAEVGAIADVVHKRGISLLVDEAHGAHLGFGKEFAENSCRQGADLVVHSVHKTLPALTQSALLHVNGDRIDRNLLRRFLHIYQTSSPSYLLMAGIDNAMNLMESEGKERSKRFSAHWYTMMRQLAQMRKLEILPYPDKRQDIGKLAVFTRKINLSPRQLYDMLLREYHIQVEMVGADYILAMFTMWDTEEGFRRMTQALLAIDHKAGYQVEEAYSRPQDQAGVQTNRPMEINAGIQANRSEEITGYMYTNRYFEINADMHTTSPAEINTDVYTTSTAEIDAGVYTNKPTEIKVGMHTNEPAKIDASMHTTSPADADQRMSTTDQTDTLPLWKAWDAPWELCSLDQAEGKYGADFIGAYPPGIPLLVPGERFTASSITYIQDAIRRGDELEGIMLEDGATEQSGEAKQPTVHVLIEGCRTKSSK